MYYCEVWELSIMLKKKIKEYAFSEGIYNAYQLSKETGIPKSTCYELYNGKYAPREATLQKLINFWGCQREDLIEEI
jgi:predicted transcriptional regulator